jgi:hypothetical protein
MIMRVPGSGTILGSLLGGLGSATPSGDDCVVDNVNDGQVAAAFEAMERGDIEYVTLESGNEFLQAAGEGAGPFALQFQPTSGEMQEVRGGVDAATARAALLAYCRGDGGWRGTSTWSAL